MSSSRLRKFADAAEWAFLTPYKATYEFTKGAITRRRGRGMYGSFGDEAVYVTGILAGLAVGALKYKAYLYALSAVYEMFNATNPLASLETAVLIHAAFTEEFVQPLIGAVKTTLFLKGKNNFRMSEEELLKHS